ncbi:hypothetical protein D3C76_771360 [compost metagenome]
MRAHLPDTGPGVRVANHRDVTDVFFEAVEIETQHAKQSIVAVDTAQLPLPVGDTDQ